MGGGNATYFRPPPLPIEKKTTQHKENMVSPPQPTEKKKKWHSPSQVDLNGTALNQTSLEPDFVFKIDRCLVNSGQINKDFLYIGVNL